MQTSLKKKISQLISAKRKHILNSANMYLSVYVLYLRVGCVRGMKQWAETNLPALIHRQDTVSNNVPIAAWRLPPQAKHCLHTPSLSNTNTQCLSAYPSLCLSVVCQSLITIKAKCSSSSVHVCMCLKRVS